MESIGRLLILLSILIFCIGIILVLGSKVGLGKLPGDILFKKGNITFYFPIVTSIIISIILSIILNLLRR